MSPLVPEFSQKSGRDAFVNNHQMPPFEKADWKGNPDMALETKYGKDTVAQSFSKVVEDKERAEAAERREIMRACLLADEQHQAARGEGPAAAGAAGEG